MQTVEIPILDWFTGDVFRSYGNTYLGAVGANSLSANAFCYKIWLERKDNGTVLKAIAYDVLTKEKASSAEPTVFNGDAEGWQKAKDWLNEEYQKYIKDGRNELTVKL